VQRTLNYTNRRKILRTEAAFSLNKGQDASFSVDFRFENVDQYPVEAMVYVEAYYKESRQRYCFGKISLITPPKELLLDKVDLNGSIQFSILIIDESGKLGKILASGNGFTTNTHENDEDNKSSMLVVKAEALKQVTWKVDICKGRKPELILNNKIPNALGRMREDTLFQALVLPAALKQVLTYYLWNAEDDEEDEHYQQWLNLALRHNDEKPETEDPEALMFWIDRVIEEFSETYGLSDKLLIGLKGE
jgi:hypothetical protein